MRHQSARTYVQLQGGACQIIQDFVDFVDEPSLWAAQDLDERANRRAKGGPASSGTGAADLVYVQASSELPGLVLLVPVAAGAAWFEGGKVRTLTSEGSKADTT